MVSYRGVKLVDYIKMSCFYGFNYTANEENHQKYIEKFRNGEENIAKDIN